MAQFFAYSWLQCCFNNNRHHLSKWQSHTRGAIKPYGGTMRMSRVDFACSVAGDGRQERLSMAHFHERWRCASWPRADCFSVELAVLQWLRSLCCCWCNDLESSKFVCKAAQSLLTHRGNMLFKQRERKREREKSEWKGSKDNREGKDKKRDKAGEVEWKRKLRKVNLNIHNKKKASYINRSKKKNSLSDLRPPQVLKEDINAKTEYSPILSLRWKASRWKIWIRDVHLQSFKNDWLVGSLNDYLTNQS